MIYPIVKYGREVLEKPGNLIVDFDGNLEKLVADMFETMYAANGVGTQGRTRTTHVIRVSDFRVSTFDFRK